MQNEAVADAGFQTSVWAEVLGYGHQAGLAGSALPVFEAG